LTIGFNMKLSESSCLLLNRLFPKPPVKGRESPRSYSEAQYEWAKTNLALFASHINLKDKDVLDAGCGLGGKTVYYAQNGCKSIIGIDMDEIRINYSKQFAESKETSNVQFKTADLNALPFDSNKFDIIFLNDVVEHLRKPILMNAFKECKRVIKPNGRICLEFPPWTSWDASHLYDYIYTPWCQLIFSTETIVNVIKKMNPKPRYGKLSVIDHFLELNRLTIMEFKEIIQELNFRVLNTYPLMIKSKQILKRLPFVNKYLTRRFVAILTK